jgi:hypothetical protein
MDRARTLIDGTDAGEIAAVVLYDLSVETAGKAVAAAEHDGMTFPGAGYDSKAGDRQPKLAPSVPLTIDQLLAAYRVRVADDKARVTELARARQLHQLRNSAQHIGRVPSPTARAEGEREALDALQWMASTFYAKTLEEISRASMITSPVVRACVESAETRAVAGELTEAIADLWVAFERARGEMNTVDPFRGDDRHLGIRQAVEAVAPRNPLSPGGGGTGSQLREVLEILERRTDDLQRRIDAAGLGDDMAEYAWFQSSTVRPHPTLNGQWHLPEPLTKPTLDDYRRGYEFVVRTVLRWQRLPHSRENAPQHTHALGEAYRELPYSPPPGAGLWDA